MNIERFVYIIKHDYYFVVICKYVIVIIKLLI